MTEPDQVLSGEPSAEPVVHLDERNRVRVDVPIEADDREAVLHERGDPVGWQAEPVDEGAVDLLGAQEGEVLLLALRVAFRRAEEHRVALAQRVLLDAADERCIEGIRDVRQQQCDRLGRLRDEAARDRVRSVAELLDGRLDRRPGGGSDLAGAVEGA